MMDPAAEILQGVDPIPDSPCADAQRLLHSLVLADPVSMVLNDDNLLIEMMDTAPIPKQANPNLSTTCVEAQRLLCSTVPSDHVSKLLENDNTSSSPAPATPLDVEDLLQEILIRLPVQPSSLPRASLVCTRWHTILSDEKFLKRYRKYHRKPPLLGFFTGNTATEHKFVPLLDTKPDRIPAERFAMPKSSSRYDQHWHFVGCRHGLTVLLSDYRREVVVWDPLTGQQHHVPYPPALAWSEQATVLCADDEDGHEHGDCFASPFKVVLICVEHTCAVASLYESASGSWINISTELTTPTDRLRKSNILIGNAVYWLMDGGDILVFDVEKQTLGVIEKPTDVYCTDPWSFELLRGNDDSDLGLAVMSRLSIQFWKRKLNCHGAVGWVCLQKTIQLEGLFPRGMLSRYRRAAMVGYDEDSNVIVLVTNNGNFMLELESMRFTTISKSYTHWSIKVHYPYRNFFTAGKGVGWKWVDLRL